MSSNLTAPTIFFNFVHIVPAPISFTPDLIYQLDSIVERVDLKNFFNATRPLELELGSGDGSFLVRYAAAHSERNFIGIERLLGRLRKIDKKGRQAGLNNLRVVRIESAYFLQYLLPAHTVAALHIYFPDPWPKRKHRRHRLINEQFPELARQALEPGGLVYLRTDDADYFDQMVRVFGAGQLFTKTETPAELAESRTDFEEDFNSRGVKTLRAAYKLTAKSSRAVISSLEEQSANKANETMSACARSSLADQPPATDRCLPAGHCSISGSSAKDSRFLCCL